jgi:DNA gyrase/topoisomerase IV subunit A
MGRATRGVRGIDLRQDDYVVSVCAVSAEDKERMLSVSELVTASRLRLRLIACSRAVVKALST